MLLDFAVKRIAEEWLSPPFLLRFAAAESSQDLRVAGDIESVETAAQAGECQSLHGIVGIVIEHQSGGIQIDHQFGTAFRKSIEQTKSRSMSWVEKRERAQWPFQEVKGKWDLPLVRIISLFIYAQKATPETTIRVIFQLSIWSLLII